MKHRIGLFLRRARRRRCLARNAGRAQVTVGRRVHTARRHAENQRRRHDLRQLHLPGRAQGDGCRGNQIHPNSFDVNRAYINVTGSLSHWFSFRITPDIVRVDRRRASRRAGSDREPDLPAQVRVRPGQLRRLPAEGLVVRLGLQQTPWIDFNEGSTATASRAPIFMDREGFLTSSDYGASVHFNFPGELRRHPRRRLQRRRLHDDQRGQRPEGLPDPRHAAAAPGSRSQGPSAHRLLRHRPLLRRTPRRSGSSAPDLRAPLGQLRRRVPGRDKDQSRPPRRSTASRRLLRLGHPADPVRPRGLFRYDEPERRTGTSCPAEKQRTVVGIAYWSPLQGGKRRVPGGLHRDRADQEHGRADSRPTKDRYALHTLFNF